MGIFGSPPRSVLRGAFFGPSAVNNTYEDANTSPLCPEGGAMDSPSPPESQRVGGRLQ